ncbi:SIMPL domain-containing protein [Stakelama marina]|uniref:SIMPL domain-containing protein n=1 Tax=Stakelama marina TaxID=2826939 RepID=A0A8T4IHU5_9SPHN|nr:SIMPL domain-containing protein [Stakelama marina]MBR0551776.1 SIMPL domain-containing protein [Stakelama marina]
MTTTSGIQAADLALQPGETLLEVQAQGETVTLPDAALISVGVVSTGTTAREATGANATDMAKVVAAIKAAGIEDRYIRTQQINVSPRFARDGANDYQGQARITGYVARNSVSVTVTDLGKASKVIDAAFGAGANSVSGPNLTLLDDHDALDAARRDGIAKARAEAATYADSLGMRVSRVIRVSERGNSARPVNYVTVTASRVGAPPPPPPPPPPVAGGEMRQQINVWVDFALVPK